MLTNKRKVSFLLSLMIVLVAAVFTVSSLNMAMAQGKGKKKALPPAKDAIVDYKVMSIHMVMEAGSGFYEEHKGGKRTIHAGVGRIDPLGVGSYVAGIGYPEAEQYPMPDYFTKTWLDTYHTELFCIYRMSDGNIFAWDGITANLEPNIPGTYVKSDYLINVIVGGTGAYEGATGMLLGRTIGGGEADEVVPGLILPKSIIKDMEGYIKIPNKK